MMLNFKGLCVPLAAGAMMLAALPSAWADDAGIHDYFLTGITAGSKPQGSAPDDATGAVPAEATPSRPTAKRHVAAKPRTHRLARPATMPGSKPVVHAHMREIKGPKTAS